MSPGFLSVAASPSAEVQVDGDSLGAAPIVRRALVAGQHDIVARHPVMGERRITVTVPTGAAVSVTVDFRR